MIVLVCPIILILLVVIAAAFAIRKKWYWTMGAVLVCLLLNWWSECFALHPFSSIETKKEDGVLRVMTYNVWEQSHYLLEHLAEGERELVQDIVGVDADVVVLNELYYGRYYKAIDSLRANYPYSNLDSINKNLTILVFSRYPIENFVCTKYNEKTGKDELTYCNSMTLLLPSGKTKLMACHLAANQISKLLPEHEVNAKSKASSILSSVSEAYSRRARQADEMRDSLDNSTMPVLVVGDYNDVGGSYALRHIKGNNLEDAWWKGGFGYGATYDMHHLHFRIDHILYSKKDFNLKGVKVLNDWKYSDHYPIVADFILKQ